MHPKNLRLTAEVLAGLLLAAGLAAGAEETPAGPAPEEAAPAADSPWVRDGVAHPGSDQIFWVPTFSQAQAMARGTGRLVFVMGSVGDWSGY